MNPENLKIIQEIAKMLSDRYTSGYISEIRVTKEREKEEYLISITPW